MAKYTAERIEEIRAHLTELDRRAVPVAQFAREIGVSPWTVYTWKRRFGAVRADLVEVERPIAPSLIEIEIGPATIRVPPRCDMSDLERVLSAVRSC